ncbi:hypothetical protein V6N13_001388 [Hibiscus sabdariffa]
MGWRWKDECEGLVKMKEMDECSMIMGGVGPELDFSARARTIVGASPHLHVVVVEHVTMGAGVVDLRVLLKAST